jgi:hypothetical protein
MGMPPTTKHQAFVELTQDFMDAKAGEVLMVSVEDGRYLVQTRDVKNGCDRKDLTVTQLWPDTFKRI